jgi:hypothetical protein
MAHKVNEAEWAYNSAELMTTMTDPLNHTATYVYDAVNAQVDQTDRGGRRTTFAYDSVTGRSKDLSTSGAIPAASNVDGTATAVGTSHGVAEIPVLSPGPQTDWPGRHALDRWADDI